MDLICILFYGLKVFRKWDQRSLFNKSTLDTDLTSQKKHAEKNHVLTRTWKEFDEP